MRNAPPESEEQQKQQLLRLKNDLSELVSAARMAEDPQSQKRLASLFARIDWRSADATSVEFWPSIQSSLASNQKFVLWEDRNHSGVLAWRKKLESIGAPKTFWAAFGRHLMKSFESGQDSAWNTESACLAVLALNAEGGPRAQRLLSVLAAAATSAQNWGPDQLALFDGLPAGDWMRPGQKEAILGNWAQKARLANAHSRDGEIWAPLPLLEKLKKERWIDKAGAPGLLDDVLLNGWGDYGDSQFHAAGARVAGALLDWLGPDASEDPRVEIWAQGAAARVEESHAPTAALWRPIASLLNALAERRHMQQAVGFSGESSSEKIAKTQASATDAARVPRRM